MMGAFFVEHSDPLEFIVKHVEHKHRYRFHVALADGRKILSPPSSNPD